MRRSRGRPVRSRDVSPLTVFVDDRPRVACRRMSGVGRPVASGACTNGTRRREVAATRAGRGRARVRLHAEPRLRGGYDLFSELSFCHDNPPYPIKRTLYVCLPLKIAALFSVLKVMPPERAER